MPVKEIHYNKVLEILTLKVKKLLIFALNFDYCEGIKCIGPQIHRCDEKLPSPATLDSFCANKNVSAVSESILSAEH